ncbi:MAG TPA: hypothetical protein DCQ97_00225 [Chitinophagaceae bacterium]|nr:hypothetical protein [Chitinophagaceae bacterium]
MQWCSGQSSILGILMPDMNGRRMIMNIKTQEVFDIECPDISHNTEPLITVGRFHFYSAAFEKANSMLEDALRQYPRWLIIDEAGKLELDKKGFYTSIVNAVKKYDHATGEYNLLITVREDLCSEVISFFNMTHYRVVHHAGELLTHA